MVQALFDEIRQRRDAVLHRSHRHQRSSMERRGDYTEAVYTRSPRVATESRSRRKCNDGYQEQQQQCSIAYELTGGVCEVARHPLHRSRSRRGAGRHTTLTVKRPPPHTSDSNHLHNHANRARKSWRSGVPIILPGWGRHMGGSRSIPTVHPCPPRWRVCG